MDHHRQHRKFWFTAAIAGAVMLALTDRPSQTYAQSTDSYSSSPASPIRETSDGPDTKSVDGAETLPIPPGAKTADSIDSTAYPGSHNSDGASVPVAGSVAPDEASSPGAKDEAVLEIPQVINPASAGTPDRPDNVPSAAGGANDDDAAQSSQGGPQTADDDDDLAGTADQVGTLEDYENQAGATPLGPLFFPPGIRIVQFPRLPSLNAMPRQPVGIPMATSPIILPPTSSGAFPSTSPMLMAPRIGTLGAFPRGGLMGFRR